MKIINRGDILKKDLDAEKKFYALYNKIENEFKEDKIDEEQLTYMITSICLEETSLRWDYIRDVYRDSIKPCEEGDPVYYKQEVMKYVFNYYANININTIQFHNFLDLSYLMFRELLVQSNNYSETDIYLIDKEILDDLESGELEIKGTLLLHMIARYGAKLEQKEENICN